MSAVWYVVDGLVGGVVLCVVGTSLGLGSVEPASYNGALPRFEVIDQTDGCKLVRILDREGAETTTTFCLDN